MLRDVPRPVANVELSEASGTITACQPETGNFPARFLWA